MRGHSTSQTLFVVLLCFYLALFATREAVLTSMSKRSPSNTRRADVHALLPSQVDSNGVPAMMEVWSPLSLSWIIVKCASRQCLAPFRLCIVDEMTGLNLTKPDTLGAQFHSA